MWIPFFLSCVCVCSGAGFAMCMAAGLAGSSPVPSDMGSVWRAFRATLKLMLVRDKKAERGRQMTFEGRECLPSMLSTLSGLVHTA